MKNQNFWNVFESSGDPIAYLIYTKSKKEDKYNKKDTNINYENKFS